MGGGVQVFADFDEIILGVDVPMAITRRAIVASDAITRLALVLYTGAASIPGMFANDDLAKRPSLTGPFVMTGMSNIGYTGEPGEVDPITELGPGPFMASAWYRFTATTTANHDILTSYPATDFDTTLGIYADPSGNGTMATIMAALIDSDDDSGSGATSYIANVPLTAGAIYAIRVDGFTGVQGNYDLGVQLS